MPFALKGLFFTFIFSFVTSAQANTKPALPVVGWIPAYGIDNSVTAINSHPAIAAGLSKIGLQFWNPSPDGKSLVYAPIDKGGKLVTDQDVTKLVQWAKQRKIQIVLTVYNNSQVMAKWDWDLARRAFAENRSSFTDALIKEMNRHGLDGIDLDLEGEGSFDSDRPAYAKFVKTLSARLKKQHKSLTIDSFHSPCMNAPNMSWWRDWRGQVDAIHSMGYQDLYEGSTDTFTPKGKSVCEAGESLFKYSWQAQFGKRAGYKQHQIIMGMPTWVDAWGKGGLGEDIRSHVQEARQLGVGVALWDLQLSAEKWRTAETWQALGALRGK
ncbi:MAG: hypothetical protein K2P84_12645 [Undibacterium sp.]|nr:hypothetical protein [Undibacterium sp.]